MRNIVTALFAVAVAVVLGSANSAQAQGRAGELAPLPAYVLKGGQKEKLNGRVARALGLNKDGREIEFPAVVTAYLDGSRVVMLHRANRTYLILAQRKAAGHGEYYLTDTSGRIIRSLEWTPVMANPAPHPAPLAPFIEIKRFWLSQLGTPVR